MTIGSDPPSVPPGGTLPTPTTSAAASVKRQDTLPTIARNLYEFGAEIGRGNMGQVTAGRDRRIGREVAIKELQRANPVSAARLEREAQLTARLQHPAIVPVYEVGRWEDGNPFYAMRRVAGRTMGEIIAARNDWKQRLDLIVQVAAVGGAIAYAHETHRVIHRDLKPSNVIVGELGDVVVIDWGLAKALDDTSPDPDTSSAAGSADLSVAGDVMGTPWYMAPEQARGEAVVEAADIYALGALLYHVLAGRPPYAESDERSTPPPPREVIERVLEGPPEPLDALEPELPRDLVAIVEKAMNRDPAKRYASAADFVVDIQAFQAKRMVSARNYSLIQRVRLWVSRHPVAVAVGAISTILLALAFIGIVRERNEAQRQRAVAEERRQEAERRKNDAYDSFYLLLAGINQVDVTQDCGVVLESMTDLSVDFGARLRERDPQERKAMLVDAFARYNASRFKVTRMDVDGVHADLTLALAAATAAANMTPRDSSSEVLALAIRGDLLVIDASTRRRAPKEVMVSVEQLAADSEALIRQDPSLTVTVARGFQKAAMVAKLVGENARAVELSRAGVAHFDRASTDSPDDVETTHQLAAQLMALGDVSAGASQLDTAIEAYDRAVKILVHRLGLDAPSVRFTVVDVLRKKGATALARRDWSMATTACVEADLFLDPLQQRDPGNLLITNIRKEITDCRAAAEAAARGRP